MSPSWPEIRERASDLLSHGLVLLVIGGGFYLIFLLSTLVSADAAFYNTTMTNATLYTFDDCYPDAVPVRMTVAGTSIIAWTECDGSGNASVWIEFDDVTGDVYCLNSTRTDLIGCDLEGSSFPDTGNPWSRNAMLVLHHTTTNGADSSPYARSVSTTSGTPSSEPSIVGNGTDFDDDGNGELIDYGDVLAAEYGTGLMAMSWFRPTVDNNNNIINKGTTGLSGWSLGASNTDFGFCVDAPVWQCTDTTATVNPTVGVDYFIVGTYDGATVRTYINGTFIDDETIPNGPVDASADTLKIGRLGPASYETDGLVDETRVYNRTNSTDQEINSTFWSMVPGFHFVNEIYTEAYAAGDTDAPDLNFISPSSNNTVTQNESWVFWNVSGSEALDTCLFEYQNVTAYWCYQEFTNQSSAADGSCGLDYTGTYAWTGTWTNPSLAANGNWSDYATWDVDLSDFRSTYKKPVGAQPGSLWVIWVGDYFENITIDSACWSQSTLNFSIGGEVAPPDTGYYACWNGGSWPFIGESISGNQQNVNEEGMWWLLGGYYNVTATVNDNYAYYNLTAQANQTVVHSRMWCNDSAGNWNVTEWREATVNLTAFVPDTIKPEIKIWFPANGTLSTAYDEVVNFTVTDNSEVDSCWWTDDDGIINTTIDGCDDNITGVWTDGWEDVRIWANDTAGNYNSSIVWFHVDGINPVASLGYNQTNASSTRITTLNFDIKCVDTNADTLKLYASWGGSWAANYTNASAASGVWINRSVAGIPDGTHTWAAWCNDTHGRTDWSENRTLTVDTDAPDIVINEPLNQTYTVAGFTLNATAYETNEMGNCTYSFNGAANATGTSLIGTIWEQAGISWETHWMGTHTSTPVGIVSNGTYIWITDATNIDPYYPAIYMYDMDGNYISKWIDVHAVGNDQPYGITMNSTHFMVSDSGDDEVYIYWANGTYTGQHWDTAASGNTDPRGMTSNGTYVWIASIVGTTDPEIYRYFLNGTPAGSFDTGADGSAWPTGITTNGSRLWVNDNEDNALYEYFMNGTFAGKIIPTGASSATDIHIEGNYMYVVNASGDEVFLLWSRNINEHTQDITAIQGINAVTWYCNDSLGNLNSSTVDFYVDTVTPLLGNVTTSSQTCHQLNIVFRVEFDQQDNLDDLTSYCNFTSPAGAVTRLSSSQSNGSRAKCSPLLDELGSWSIVAVAEDYANNTATWTGSINVDTTCLISNIPSGGGGGPSPMSAPVNISLVLIPDCKEGYVYDVNVGRCRLPESVTQNLTNEGKILSYLLAPRFGVVNYEFPATDPATGQAFTVTYSAYLLSIFHVVLISITAIYLWAIRRKQKGKFRKQDKLLGITVGILIVISISTAFPPDVQNAILGTGTFVPGTSVQLPSGEVAGATVSYNPPEQASTFDIPAWAANNPYVLIAAVILAGALIVRSKKR